MENKTTHAGENDAIKPKECLSKATCFLQDCAQRGNVKGLVVQEMYRTDNFAYSYRRLIYADDARPKGVKWRVRVCPACGLDLNGYSTPAEQLVEEDSNAGK